MDERRRPLLRATTALLLATQLLNVAPVLAATAPVKPAATASKNASLIASARTFYEQARYDEAVGLLAGPVLRKEITGQELIEARLLLARCYVKKGILARAKQHFEAILAIDPSFTLDRTKVDADELAVFDEVKGVPSPPAPGEAAGKGTAPEGKAPATAGSQPQLHKPVVASSGGSGQSWLSRNKYLAIGLVVGGGVAAGFAFSGGNGGGGGNPPGPTTLPGFPAVPGGH